MRNQYSFILNQIMVVYPEKKTPKLTWSTICGQSTNQMVLYLKALKVCMAYHLIKNYIESEYGYYQLMIRQAFRTLTRFSSINQPPSTIINQRQVLNNNGWRNPDPTHRKSLKTHLSNGQILIHKVPIIYVETNIVRCIGGTELNAGHPQQYIQLNTKNPEKPSTCKYCGLRYQMAHNPKHEKGHPAEDRNIE